MSARGVPNDDRPDGIPELLEAGVVELGARVGHRFAAVLGRRIVPDDVQMIAEDEPLRTAVEGLRSGGGRRRPERSSQIVRIAAAGPARSRCRESEEARVQRRWFNERQICVQVARTQVVSWPDSE